MLKLLGKPYVVEALKLMQDYDVLPVILPQTNIYRLEQFLKIYPTATVLERFAILVPEADKVPWKWSRAQQKKLCSLTQPVQISQEEVSNRYLLWKLGKEAYLYHLTLSQLTHSLSQKQFHIFKNLTMPIFPVEGGDLFQLGFRGSVVRQQLEIAEKIWVELGFPSEKKLVMENLLRYNEKKTISGEG